METNHGVSDGRSSCANATRKCKRKEKRQEERESKEWGAPQTLTTD